MITKETKLEKLFSPLEVGKKTLKNRIVSAAHATGWEMDGIISEKHIRYLEKKAEGGASLILTFGSASVHKESSASYGSISLWDERNEPALKDLANRVHAHGALIMSQATHMGRRATSVLNGRPVSAISWVPEEVHNDIPHILRTDEMPPIVQAFADAAKRLESCGWDGIEITSFGGHLIEQFWSPKINNRTDKYGGDFEGRMRFSIEVVEAVRSAVSDDFIIGFRLTGDPMTEVLGLDKKDMLKIAQRLDKLGCIDLFNIGGSTGATYQAQSIVVPGDTVKRGVFNDLAKKMKEHLSVPVLVSGRILDPLQAEQTLLEEKCDLVGMTRAIIADPYMPRLAERGEFSSIRPCIACTEGCIGRLYSGMPILCTVNPGIEDDSLYDIPKTIQKQKVVIIGGGPAGLEAARISAIEGHDVTILEKSNKLGGKVLLTEGAKDRPHYRLHIEWLEKELNRLGVKVYFNFEGNEESILEFNPDIVVLANGAKSFNPYLSELKERYSIVHEKEVLGGDVSITSETKAIVFDREGVYRGVSVAAYIAESGAEKVEIATQHWSVGDKLDDMRKGEIYTILGKNKVINLPNKELIVDENSKLILKDLWSEEIRFIEKDELIVLVGYEQGDNTLYENIRSKAPKLRVYQIGDSVSPRRLHDAIREGAQVAINI